MKSSLNCNQHQSILVPMVIDGADGSPEILEGSSFATVADSGTGIYTVTFNDAFGRAPVIVGACVTATGDVLVPTFRSVTAAGFVVELSTDGGTLTDGIVMLQIWGSYSADEA